MQWFLDLLRELGIECQVGDATKIRAAEPRKQKHDRRDAELILKPRIKLGGYVMQNLIALCVRCHGERCLKCTFALAAGASCRQKRTGHVIAISYDNAFGSTRYLHYNLSKGGRETRTDIRVHIAKGVNASECHAPPKVLLSREHYQICCCPSAPFHFCLVYQAKLSN